MMAPQCFIIARPGSWPLLPSTQKAQTIELGDLAPGSVDVAAFTVSVDGNAGLQDYQLGCEIDCQEKSITVPVQISLSSAGGLGYWALPVFALPGYSRPGSFSDMETRR